MGHIKKNKKTNEYYLKHMTQVKIKKTSSFLKQMHFAHANSQHIGKSDQFHQFALVKLNVYTLDNAQTKTKISSTAFMFIDCASFPKIDALPTTAQAEQDYNHLN